MDILTGCAIIVGYFILVVLPVHIINWYIEKKYLKGDKK